jgi:hypothetical protein
MPCWLSVSVRARQTLPITSQRTARRTVVSGIRAIKPTSMSAKDKQDRGGPRHGSQARDKRALIHGQVAVSVGQTAAAHRDQI